MAGFQVCGTLFLPFLFDHRPQDSLGTVANIIRIEAGEVANGFTITAPWLNIAQQKSPRITLSANPRIKSANSLSIEECLL